MLPYAPVVLPAVVPALPVEPVEAVVLVDGAVVAAVSVLVCEVVGGMPAFALTAPVVPAEADLSCVELVALGAVLAEAEVFGSVELVAVLGVALGEVLAEAEVLGSVEAVLGVVVLPAVVDGPVAEAEVPGAEAEVLAVVELVPVCAAVPEAVVLLPGFVVAVLGLLVEVGEELTELLLAVSVLLEALFAPLRSALLEVEALGVALEAEVVLSTLLVLEVFDPHVPVARTLWPTCAVRSWLDCSSTALPCPVCSQNLPSFSAMQPVICISLPFMPLADEAELSMSW